MFDANSLEMRAAAGRNSVGCSMRERVDRQAACSEGGFSVGLSEDRSCAMPADDAGPADLDYLYNMIDKLYHEYARGCGLSDCAYWMLYDLESAGGAMPQRELAEQWCYSKQTISSALKSLESKGLVALDYEEGSRRSKVVALTDAGRAFSHRRIVPAMEAEKRAFLTLAASERFELLRLVRRYASALEQEIRTSARASATAVPADEPESFKGPSAP